MKTLHEQIRELVTEDKLEKALDLLSDFLKDKDAELYDEATSHRATLARNKKERRRGLISSDDEDLKRTNVRFAILESLLPAIEDSSGEGDGGKPTVKEGKGDKPPGKTPKSVFISYNHGDSAMANKLKEALQAHGVAVTIDQAMQAGQGIQAFILDAIRSTDVTVSIVSNKSLRSAWVAMESINTFYQAQFDDEKMFIACYIDDDFFQPRFRLDATDTIDARIREIDVLLPEYINRKLDPVDLNEEKSRLFNLRNHLGEILRRLKESLCLDLRDDHFDESLASIISAITVS